MHFAEITCRCGANYTRIESSTLAGSKGHFDCQVCGETLEAWIEPKKLAYRLNVSPQTAYRPAQISAPDFSEAGARLKN